MLALELNDDEVDEVVVKVLIIEDCVSSGGLDLKYPLMVGREMSKVPPPRTKMRTLNS